MTQRDAGSDLERSRAETRAAFENRALLYHHIFVSIAEEIGRERAADVLRRAIRRRGVEVGAKYRAAVEARDLDEVGRIFCEDSPCAGGLFEPAVEERGDDWILLRMTGCPLVDAWEGLGLPPDEVDLLCEVAAAVDYGTFEGAGLALEFLDRKGVAGSERCLLRLTLRRS